MGNTNSIQVETLHNLAKLKSRRETAEIYLHDGEEVYEQHSEQMNTNQRIRANLLQLRKSLNDLTALDKEVAETEKLGKTDQFSKDDMVRLVGLYDEYLGQIEGMTGEILHGPSVNSITIHPEGIN